MTDHQNRQRRTLIGATAVVVALSLTAMALPVPYVVESPGPTLNTVGDVDGEPVLSVNGAESYRPESGQLDLTTVYVSGGGDRTLTFFDALGAWADPHRDVFPAESVYPRGVTGEEISEQNTAQMDQSQETSVAAALTFLDMEYDATIRVVGFATETNADVLEEDDVVTELDGERMRTVGQLQDGLQAEGEHRLTVVRGGEPVEVPVETETGEDGTSRVGIYLRTDFEFPLDVTFGLEDIGGPSAGMMFSLGIIDLLTPGDLTGGKHIAGTGAVTAEGEIEPIGGIAQKLVGASDAGAEVFLAPQDNCGDVVGRIPDGMTVLSVSTLEDAYDAVSAAAANEDLAALSSCG
ncbi:YlbL family protein [Zhihengliuella flava]|uniref:endopeptidase La n=1 Tax=Zhihengliuella flava TaxID=1285193 RepID=A0A931D8G9_9MICC|nr:PDZ domain-containing protein [Zhihengliuella flava]